MINSAHLSTENTAPGSFDTRQPGSSATRNPDSQSLNVLDGQSSTEVLGLEDTAAARLDSLEPATANPGQDISDSAGADAVGFSLRQGILGESSTAMLAQANLSPQSVLRLLQ